MHGSIAKFFLLSGLIVGLGNSLYCQKIRTADSKEGSAIEDKLIKLERSMWDLYKAKDAKALAALTPDDFYDIYSDGTAVGKDRWLKDMLDFEVKDSTLTDFKVIRLTKDAAIVVYTAVAHGTTAGGKEISIHNAVTSGWGRRNGKWLNVFYRENVIQ